MHQLLLYSRRVCQLLLLRHLYFLLVPASSCKCEQPTRYHIPRTVKNSRKINAYDIYNKCTSRSRTPTALALAGEPLVAVPLPVTILLAIEANGLCVRSRLRCRGWSWDHILVLALCVSLLLGP